MRNIRRHKQAYRRLLVLILIILVLLLLGMQGWRLYLSRLVEVQHLKKDTSSQEIYATAILAKQETLVLAPVEGDVEMLLRDGERLKSGIALAKIAGINGRATVYSPCAGMVCTHVDELEGILKPENINTLDIQAIKKMNIPHQTQSSKLKIEKGMPFCKIVDNLNPILMFLWRDDKNVNMDLENMDLDERHGLDILWQGERMYGRVLERQKSLEAGFWVEISSYPERLLHLRQLDVQVIIKEMYGYSIPCNALVFNEGQAGIYIIKNGFVRWTPVHIAGRVEDQVVLNEDGLDANIRFVSNPSRVQEGSRVK